jgi:hypothetical protein
MINIGIGISWAKAIYSVANNVIANFKARVLSYPNSIFEAGPCLDATLEGLNAKGLLDNASLIITPNAYNTGILYSVVPNTTLGDMTVVRATTATRVNSAGLIEVVPRNLLTYSQDFSNVVYGGFNQLSLTANAGISPDGNNNAFLFTKNTSSIFGWKSQSNTSFYLGVTYTFSAFVKKGTVGNTAIIRVAGGAFPPAIVNEFNFDTETITNGGSFTKLENGWYRISGQRTATSTGSGDFQIGVISVLTTDLNNVLMYGAQLETGSTATEYFPTTTRLNIPRIDYTNGSCPSLLVEPQRTNVALYSEQFDNAYWGKQSGATVVSNTNISPDGNQNADTINLVSGSTISRVEKAGNLLAANTFYTISIFLKNISLTSGQTFQLRYETLGFDLTGTIDLFNKTNVVNVTGIAGTGYVSGTQNAKITELSNGWVRCSIGIQSGSVVSGAATLYLITNVNANRSFYAYGMQLEVGSYATSYIPTVASTVTRNADVISKTGISSLIGQTEGTLFCEINLPNPLSTGGKAIVIIGTSPNRIYIAKEGTTTNIFQLATQSASGFNFINSSVITTSKVKFAIAYKGSNNAFYINGSLISSASATANPTSFSDLLIGDTSPQTNTDIKINSVQLYKTRLSNSELAQLTTL